MTTDAKALAQAPSRLREQAKMHKRLSGQHRREAKRLMQEAAELETELAALGVSVEWQTPGSRAGQARPADG